MEPIGVQSTVEEDQLTYSVPLELHVVGMGKVRCLGGIDKLD